MPYLTQLLLLMSFLSINNAPSTMTSSATLANFSLTADHENHHYQVGETIQFLVETNNDEVATYQLYYDKKSPLIAEGSVEIEENTPTAIHFLAETPGLVFCEVQIGNIEKSIAVTIAPFDIQPLVDEPDDFDAFWETQKAELATIDMDTEIEETDEEDYATAYEISFANVDDRRTYGYLSVPTGNGPFPAVLVLPAYGDNANIASPQIQLSERAGVIGLSLNIHNAPHGSTDPNAYEPDDITEPEGNYFRHVILGISRSIDYLTSRPDFNGQLAVMGVSQGGGLALIAAGLEEEVDLLIFSNPALCQHAGLAFEQASGFPYYLHKSVVNDGTDAHFQATLEATKYYEAAFFARRYEGPSLSIFSYKDLITPAATGLSALNQLRGEQIVFHNLELGHSHPGEYWNGRYDFLRQHFPATLDAPFPWSDTTKHYHIDAGEHQGISANMTTLTGTISKDSQPIDLPVYWRMLTGPANAIFADSTELSTSVELPVSGIYTFQLVAYEEEMLEEENSFFTLSDVVTIQKGTLNLTCPDAIAITIAPNETGATVDWEMPTVINNCDNADALLTQISGATSGDFLALGTHIISYEASNNCDEIVTCSFEITITTLVTDLTINCPENIVMTLPIGETTAIANWEMPEVTGNCPIGNTELVQVLGELSGSNFSEGTHTISYTASDNCGQIETCSFTVTMLSAPTEPAEYCETEGDFPWHDWIGLVVLEDIDNASGKKPYSDFTDEVAFLQRNQSYPMTLGVDFTYFTYEAHWKVWIDFNQDGIFQEPAEVVVERLQAAPTEVEELATIEELITIPTTANLGNTRMRVAKSRTEFAAPCEVFDFGEVEDYTVNIGADSFVIPAQGSMVSEELNEIAIFPNPVNNSLHIHLSTSILEKNSTLQIFNNLGQKVAEQLIRNTSLNIDVSAWNSGVYWMQYLDENGEIQSLKWLKI